jgi:diguanylate cyclase (GGDEF)-like protein
VVDDAGRPFPDTGEAVRAAFAVLRVLTGLPSWYLVAARGVPVVLQADGDVPVGDVWPWADVADPRTLGPGPAMWRVAGGVVVAAAIREGDGSRYAALCGVGPGEPPAAAGALAALGDQARLVASVLEHARRTAGPDTDALLDPLTRLPNRRAWEHLLEREEARCRRTDVPAGVLVIDIDGLTEVNRTGGRALGDDLLVRAATVLLRSSRGADVVARLSGDRFAILASGATEGQMSALGTRLRLRLAGARVPASVGWASRRGDRDLAETWTAADRDMLRAKQSLGRRMRPPI